MQKSDTLVKKPCSRGRAVRWRRRSKRYAGADKCAAKVKKLCWHTTFGDICVEEPQYRRGTRRERAFAGSAKVSHRGCSRPLQRAITDFGAHQSFAQVMDKLVEHCGIVLGESKIRRITEGHARQIHANCVLLPAAPRSEFSAMVIVKMDGDMVPLVESNVSCTDRGKGKKLLWKEAKLCLVHPQRSKTPAYGGTLQGDVRVAGRQLADCAARTGFDARTEVHAVGVVRRG